MQIVDLGPQGQHEFPDDATPEEIQAAIDENFPNPNASFFDRQAPIKAASRAAVESLGGQAKGAALISTMPLHEPGMILPSVEREAEARQAERTPAQKFAQVVTSPLYQAGENLQQGAAEAYPLSATEQQGILTKAGAAVGGFVPFVAEGPLGTVGIGLQSAGERLQADFQAQLDKQKSPDEAAQAAMNKALASGALQTAVFAALPKPLRDLGDKYIDKFTRGVVSRFLLGRAAQAGEGAVLGTASQAVEQAVNGELSPEKLAESAFGLGLIQAFMPRGRTATENEARQAFEGPAAPGTTLDPRVQAWAESFGGKFAPFAPPRETEMVRTSPEVFTPGTPPRATILSDMGPQGWVPPEPGPMQPIPPIETPPIERPQNATIDLGQQQQSRVGEYPGVAQGQNVRPNVPEVRQAPGTETGSGDSLARGGPVEAQTPTQPQVNLPPLPPGNTPIKVQRPDGTLYDAAFGGWQIADVQGNHIPLIARPVEGGWTTGGLQPGEKIVGEIPPKPEPQPLTPLKPAAPEEPPKPARPIGISGIRRFNAETEIVGPDILSWMIQTGNRIMAKSTARRSKGAAWWKENGPEWDDAPERFAAVHHNVIYGGERTPDKVAQDAFRDGLIPDGLPATFWAAVKAASKNRIEKMQDRERLDKMTSLEAKWAEATSKDNGGPIPKTTEDLAIGDKLEVDGEKIEVVKREANGDVLLKDGRKFGTQVLKEGDTIYVEKFEEGTPQGSTDIFASEETPPTPAQQPVVAGVPVGGKEPPTTPTQPAPPAPAVAPEPGLAKDGTTVSGYVKYNGKWYKLSEDGTLPMVKRKNGGEGPKGIPANTAKSADLEKDAKAGPAPEETRTPAQILNQASQVRVKLPEGATVLRITDTKGKRAEIFIADLNKGSNILQGVDIKKMEPGRITRDGFAPVKGDVTVADVGKKRELIPSKAPEGLPAQMGGQGVVLTFPEVGMPRNLLPAYHGTPHEVDRFTTEKIGTGEGAQVYGWGLYFAENRAVGEQYQKGLSEFTLDGKPIREVSNSLPSSNLELARREGIDINEASRRFAEQKPFIEAVNALASYGDNADTMLKSAESKAVLRQLTESGRLKKQGNLYTVDINAKPEELLDWDKPLNQQPESIRNALEKLGFDRESSRGWGYTGEELYHYLSNYRDQENMPHAVVKQGGKREASDKLASLGIKGIRYLDQGSRNASSFHPTEESAKFASHIGDTIRQLPNGVWEVVRPRTYNYVIFDDSVIRITDKNGKPVTMDEARKAMLNANEAMKDPSRRAVVMGEPIKIESTADIRRVLDDKFSNITQDHRKFFSWLLNKGLLDKYPNLRLEVVDEIQRGSASQAMPSGEHIGNVSRFLRWTDSDVPLHEFMHHVENFLAPADRQWLHEERLRAIAKDAPQTGDLFTAGMDSDTFMAKKLSPDLYHLSNDSEFFAWMMTQRGLKDLNRPEATTFVGKVRQMISDLWQAVKASLGLTSKEDALWRHILKGEMEYRPADAIKWSQERQASLSRAVEQFPEKAAESPEEAKRGLGIEQAESVIASKPVAREALAKASAEAAQTGRLEPAERWSRDIAKKVLSNPLIRVMRKSADLLDRSAALVGGDVANYEKVSKDPASTPAEISNAAGNALTGFRQWQRARFLFQSDYYKKRDRLTKDVATIFDRETAAIERADKADILLNDLRAIGRNIVSQSQDAATIAAYRYVMDSNSIPAARNVVDFITRNNIDLSGAVIPAMIRERMTAAAGPNFEQAVGANSQTIDAVVRIIAESEIIRERLTEAQQVTREQGEAAPVAEVKREISSALAGGNYERALELFGRGVRDVAGQRAVARSRVSFYARQTRDRLAAIRALDEVSGLMNNIEADPQFIAERRAVFDKLGVRDVLYDETGISLVLKPVREGGEDVKITEGNDPRPQREILDKVDAYRKDALELIAEFRDDPNSKIDPSRIAGLEAIMPIIDNILDPSLNPGAERLIPSGLFFPARKFLTLLRRPELTPQWAIQGGAGPAFARTEATLNAMSTVHEVHGTLLNKYDSRLKLALKAAQKSHGKMSPEDYRVKVWNQIAGSLQNFMDTRQAKVGAALGNGEVVTPADMNYLAVARALERDLFNASNNIATVKWASMKHVLSGVLLDPVEVSTRVRNKTKNLLSVRFPFAIGPETMSRHIPTGDVRGWIEKWGAAKTDDAKIAFLNANFDRLVLGYVDGVSRTDWVTKGTYGYLPELRSVIKDMGARPLETFEDLAERVLDERLARKVDDIPPTLKDVQSNLLSEFDDIFRKLVVYDTTQQAKSKKLLTDIWGGDSAFNTPRGNLVMPPAWYDYGGLTTAEYGRMMRAMTFPFDRAFVMSLDMLRQSLADIVKGYKLEGNTAGRKLIASSLADRRAGERIYSYGDAEQLLGEVTRLHSELSKLLIESPKLVQTDRTYAAATSGPIQAIISSLLITPQAAFKNFGGYLNTVLFDRAIRNKSYAPTFVVRGLKLFPEVYREVVTKIGNIGNPEGRRLYHLLADARTKPIVGNVAEFFLRTMEKQREMYQVAQDLGLMLNRDMAKQMRAYWSYATSGGSVVTDPMASVLHKAGGVIGTISRSAATMIGQAGVGQVDSFLNRIAISSLADLETDFMARSIKCGKAMVEQAAAAGRDPYDFTKAENQLPNQIFGGDRRAIYVRDFFRGQGTVNIDRTMMDFYRRYTDAKAREAAEGVPPGTYTSKEGLFTPEQRNQMFMALAQDFNLATFANRPIYTKQNKGAQILGMFLGYPTWQFHKYVSMFNTSSRKSFARGHLENLPYLLATGAAMALMTTLIAEGYEQIKNLLQNKYSAYPTLSKARSPEAAARAIAAAMASEFPLYGGLAWSMFDLGYQKGFNLESQLVAFGAANDIFNTGKEIVQSGDFVMPTVRLASRYTFPLNVSSQFLPQMSGLREMTNTRAIIESAVRAQGDSDLIKDKPTVMETKYTPATPYVNGAMNAIGNGDMGEFSRNFAEIVRIRAEAGDQNPEAAARKLIESRNPVANVFKKRPTEAELQNFLNGLPAGQREIVQQALNNFSNAISSVGGTAAYTQEAIASGRSAGGGGAAGAGVPSAGRISSFSAGGAPRASLTAVSGPAGGGGRLRIASGGRSISLGGVSRGSRLKSPFGRSRRLTIGRLKSRSGRKLTVAGLRKSPKRRLSLLA